MNTHRFFTSAIVLASLAHSLGCTATIDSESAGEAEDTAESAAPLVNGTTTTDFAPVVRITWSRSYSCGFLDLSTCTSTHYCTATAIADDLLVTASHCVKDGTRKADHVDVSVAHGANSDAEGKSSSFLIMSEDLYENVSADDTDEYWYRDFTFIKFGAGTFSEYYGTTYTSGGANGWSVTKVGFGGNSTKEYATKTVAFTDYYGDYKVALTARSGAYGENGDSGGPLLKWNSTTNDYEVLGVVFGTTKYSNEVTYDSHPIFSSAMETNILAPLRTALPGYCAEGFQNSSYGGVSWAMCPETKLDAQLDSFSDPFIVREHWDHSDWNDKFSSLTLPSENTILTVYEDTGPGGDSVTFTNMFSFGDGAAVSSLSNEGFNDKASSYIIWSGGSGGSYTWHLEITRYGKCIDTSGTWTAGTNVYQYDCQSDDDETNQLFKLEASGSNYKIKHNASGLCLGAENGGTSNNTMMGFQTCDGSTNQLFSMSSNSSTSSVRDFKIVHVNSSKCLDLDAGSSSNGTGIQLWTCNSTNTNQNFALKKLY